MTRPASPFVVALSAMLALSGCGRERVTEHEVEPLSPLVHNMLSEAMSRLQRRDLKGALAAAERAREAAPGAYEVYLVEGQIRLAARDLEGARAALRDATKRNAAAARPWEMLGHVSIQERAFREAISNYSSAIAREESAFAWQGIGDAYRELYEPDSAAAAYHHALRVDETFTPAWAALAEIEEDAGNYAVALGHAERAVGSSPRSTSYQYLRARLLVQSGRAWEAIPILEEIVQRDSTHVGGLYNLGLAYVAVGQQDLGDATLARAARVRHLSRVRKPL